MFFIKIINFKNDLDKTNQLRYLISLTVTGIWLYVFGSDFIHFISGSFIGIEVYFYVLILIYFIGNIFITYQLSELKSEICKSNVVEKADNKTENILTTKVVKEDFIFSKTIFYDIKNERKTLVPEFGNAGLNYENEEERIVQEDTDVNVDEFQAMREYQFNQREEGVAAINEDVSIVENIVESDEFLEKKRKREALFNELINKKNQ